MIFRFLIFFISFLYIPSSYAMCQVDGTWYSSSSKECSPQPLKPKTQNTTPRNVAPSISNPICSIGYEKAYSDLKNEIRRRHPDAYSIQKTLIDSNMKSFKKLCSLKLNSVKKRVLDKQLNRHYPKFSIIETLFERDMKAYYELR